MIAGLDTALGKIRASIDRRCCAGTTGIDV
jgi:hypothetical protein